VIDWGTVVAHIFVGPTLVGQDVLDILPNAVLHPPVAHGDLLGLELARGDVVVIVDGFYHQEGSVRHKEILSLLADGILVVGCASIGALRAAELAEYGMIGNGAVFRMYRDGVIEADEEVAVAHTPEPEYRSLTVPSVVLRCMAAAAVRAGVIDQAEADSVVDLARAVHYTERSWQAVWRAVEATDSVADAGVRLRKFVDSCQGARDIKAEDALDTLRKVADGALPDIRHLVESWVSGDWRNRHLGEWQAEFAVSVVDDIEVEHGTIVRYQQLYLKDFPARWQQFALTRIAGIDVTGVDLIESALAKAARCGVSPAALTDAQLAYWLTRREVAELTRDQALVRVLVRSYRPLRGRHDLVEDQPDLVEDATARRLAAEAAVVNAEVASWGGKHTVDHLKTATLLGHLAQIWQLDEPDPVALLAAARDRGFPTIDDAAYAARMFFLHKTFLAVPAKKVG
jgi:hypothetical protein